MKKTLFGFSTKEVNETIDTLTNQNTALIQRNDRLEEDIKDLKIQLEEAKVASEGCLSRAESIDYETIKSNYESLSRENAQLSASAKALQDELTLAKGEAEEARSELARVQFETQQSLEYAKTQAAQASETIEQLKSEATRNTSGISSEEFKKVQEEVYSAQQALEQERTISAAARSEVEKYRRSAEQAQSLTSFINRQLEQQKNENAFMKQQLEEAQKNLETARNEKQAAANNDVVNEYLYALQQACERIDSSKGEIGEKMRTAINKFIEEWTTAESELREMTVQMDQARQNAQAEFINSTNAMMSALSQLEEYNVRMNDNINDIESRKVKLQDELENVIDEFTQTSMLKDESKTETNIENSTNYRETDFLPFVSNK